MKFVNIETFFPEKQLRTIEYLSNLYTQIPLLKDRIRKVSVGTLDNETIIKGKKILLKPNWVLHNRKNTDEICLKTHNNFLLATVELLLEQKPSKIIIGDAPVQGCNWDKMLSKDFLATIDLLGSKNNIPIIVKDFRRVTFDTTLNNPIKERNPLSDYLIFDLGKDSYLEPISSEKNIFRVTNYDPDRLAESHRKGVHKYCITKELFDADVIISLPKVKTHQKTGITCALKNLVGINGDKDYLPHHRIGGTHYGGDCYPGNNILRLWSEYLLDKANRRQGKKSYKFWVYLSLLLWKLAMPKNVHNLAAAWFGNDTTWRMVMDLNKIVVFGKSDGTIAVEPQRTLFSLCDGIIGGQGDGPLNPEPLPLGIITFTNNSGLNDICMTQLMNFDYKKFPLLSNSIQPLLNNDSEILLNGEKIEFSELTNYSIETTPPPGWVNYLSNLSKAK